MSRERNILHSETPCPECGGTCWQRWRFGADQLERLPTSRSIESTTAAGHALSSRWTARADWPAHVAAVLDFGTCFDLCARCGLVIR